MEYQIEKARGITNRGNLGRIKALMKRARAGERIVIGFIGGSITQGANSSAAKKCYAYRVFEWWCGTFPLAELVYVNAGIGGTTSQFGVARVEEDLLKKEPDFVVIEFSVNDKSTEHFLETYEGLVRKVYNFRTKPAVLLVHNVYYDTGANAQIQHSKVGRHYDLPCISMQSSIYPELLNGYINNREITEDDLHPNDVGHRLVASVITYFLEEIYKEVDITELPEAKLPEPLTKNGYENSVRYQNKNYTAKCRGFTEDKSVQRDVTDCFKNGWIARKKGDSISFIIEGTGIAVAYRRSASKPAPIARAVVDGDEEHGVWLDANFEETWGDKLEVETLGEHMRRGRHKLEITLAETHEDDVVPFYLVSVIGTK